MKPSEDTEVRIIYSRSGFESKIGHHVRSKMEAVVCEWLMEHGVAHRHGSEMFTVRVGASGTPTAYVPDIVLHDKDELGRTVLIEPFDAPTPRIGGTRIIATFRKEMKKSYRVIIVAKKQQMGKVLEGAYDVIVDYSRLNALEKELPLPPR
ncbi:MAG TPA: hypothetical protein DGH68_01865 [Bacteroidetes bacterium]|nr:hypothetical protein [Bacteroidota bacterium]